MKLFSSLALCCALLMTNAGCAVSGAPLASRRSNRFKTLQALTESTQQSTEASSGPVDSASTQFDPLTPVGQVIDPIISALNTTVTDAFGTSTAGGEAEAEEQTGASSTAAAAQDETFDSNSVIIDDETALGATAGANSNVTTAASNVTSTEANSTQTATGEASSTGLDNSTQIANSSTAATPLNSTSPTSPASNSTSLGASSTGLASNSSIAANETAVANSSSAVSSSTGSGAAVNSTVAPVSNSSLPANTSSTEVVPPVTDLSNSTFLNATAVNATLYNATSSVNGTSSSKSNVTLSSLAAAFHLFQQQVSREVLHLRRQLAQHGTMLQDIIGTEDPTKLVDYVDPFVAAAASAAAPEQEQAQASSSTGEGEVDTSA